MNNTEEALYFFSKGYNCSQSVLTAFAKDLGLTEEEALKISSGFGGGIARMQLTCGAVTGAVMAIGLKYGHLFPDDAQQKDKTYALIQEFIRAFEEKHHTINCRELLNCDLSTEEGRLYAKENSLSEKICRNCILDAAELLSDILYKPK